jgi:thiosulfate/3-mercaptopyruvate sulfurtransferase
VPLHRSSPNPLPRLTIKFRSGGFPVTSSRLRRSFGFLAAISPIFLFALATASLPLPAIHGDEKKPGDPLPNSHILRPADLAKELTDKSLPLPTVVYVGFRSLYVGGHIPQASFHGTAFTKPGLAELKAWAATLPRSTDLVIYCGCCPFDKCPNIHPAYTALSSLGFKKLRVLVLPTNFATDWVDKGYPMQKGI